MSIKLKPIADAFAHSARPVLSRAAAVATPLALTAGTIVTSIEASGHPSPLSLGTVALLTAGTVGAVRGSVSWFEHVTSAKKPPGT